LMDYFYYFFFFPFCWRTEIKIAHNQISFD